MPSFVNTIAKGAVALLGVAGVASAAPSALSNTTMILEGRNYTPACRNACLAADAQYMLVTECTVDGGTTDTSYQWAEFDLNNILGYSSPDLVYQSLSVPSPLSFPSTIPTVRLTLTTTAASFPSAASPATTAPSRTAASSRAPAPRAAGAAASAWT